MCSECSEEFWLDIAQPSSPYRFNKKIMASEGNIHTLNTYSSSADSNDDEDIELDVENAIEKLTESLRGAEYAIPITHGRPFVWRRCKFQAHASPAQFPRDVQYVMDKLRGTKPWSNARYHPCAYRLSSGDPMIQQIGVDVMSREGGGGGTTETSDQDNLLEGCGDGEDPGSGDKLLDLLRRWDIQNVVLCVTCWDDGLRGRLGSGRFRLYLDSAKSVLEQCYIDSVSVSGSSTAGGSSSSGGMTDDGSRMDEEDAENYEESEGGTRIQTSGSYAISVSSSHGGSISRIGRVPGNGERSELKNISERGGRGRGGGGGGGRGGIPRGADLLKMYQQARERFMPVRPEYQHVSKSFVDADTIQIPLGRPDGLGNFEDMNNKKGGRVNHFLAVAPDTMPGAGGGMDSDGPSMYDGGGSGDGGSGGGGNYEGSEMSSAPSSPLYNPPPIPIPSITRNQLDEAKSIVRPHELTHRVFRCVGMLLGYRDTTWPGCRAMLASPSFLREMQLLSPLSIPFEEIEEVREVLSELGPSFNPGNVQRQSILAADCLEWCIRVVRSHYVATAQSSHASYYGSDGGLNSAGGVEGGGGGGGGDDIDAAYVFDDDYDTGSGGGGGQQQQQQSSIAYVNGTPKQALAVRVMRMDPNPDYGGQPKAKIPKTEPLHRRNDVGPQPVRVGRQQQGGRQVFKNAARDYLSTGGEERGGGGGRSGGSSRVGLTPTTGRTDRSSIAGWGKSRGSVRGGSRRAGDSDSGGVVPVNKW